MYGNSVLAYVCTASACAPSGDTYHIYLEEVWINIATNERIQSWVYGTRQKSGRFEALNSVATVPLKLRPGSNDALFVVNRFLTCIRSTRLSLLAYLTFQSTISKAMRM